MIFMPQMLNVLILARFARYSILNKILITKGPKGPLGRSPEEKVKCHSGPLILSTKYW